MEEPAGSRDFRTAWRGKALFFLYPEEDCNEIQICPKYNRILVQGAYLSTEPRKLIFKISKERRPRNNNALQIFEGAVLLPHGNDGKLCFP